MALPTAAPERQLKHRRSIDVQVFARGDGLWEADARITDIKTRDAMLAHQVRRAGDPIHDMMLRVVVDEACNIVDAGSSTAWMPYVGQCDDHADAYRQLVGLNLLKNFRRELTARLGGVRGCTHLTELAQVLPTAVVQAFAGEVIDTHGHEPDAKQPFQIDRCHALRSEGPVVQEFYPRWYRRPDQTQAGRAEQPAIPTPPVET